MKNNPLNPPEGDLKTSPKKPPLGGLGGYILDTIKKWSITSTFFYDLIPLFFLLCVFAFFAREKYGG